MTAAPPIPEAYRFQLQQAATWHCQQVWPAIEAFRVSRDLRVLEPANLYLGELKVSSVLMYNIVMRLLSMRSGVDWPSIRDAVA